MHNKLYMTSSIIIIVIIIIIYDIINNNNNSNNNYYICMNTYSIIMANPVTPVGVETECKLMADEEEREGNQMIVLKRTE